MNISSKQLKWFVGVFVIGFAIVAISMLNFGGSIVYFYTPQEAQANPQELNKKTIMIGAMVKENTLKRSQESLDLEFMITDYKGHEIKVFHYGTPPDLFREGSGVVVEGRLAQDGQSFKSHKLLVKHSEEYRKPDDHQNIDKALLEKSLFKSETVGKE